MDNLQQVPLTLNFSVPVTVHGTTTSISTTNAINYSIKGKAFTKGNLSNTALTSANDINSGAAAVALAASQGSVYVLMLDASGNLRFAQGSVVALDGTTTGNFNGPSPQFPMIPDNFCPFAYVIVQNGSAGSAWTFGSSNYNASGITWTAVDICTLPFRPQIS